MKKKEAGEKVTAKQGLLLLFAAVLVIVVCKIVFSVDYYYWKLVSFFFPVQSVESFA